MRKTTTETPKKKQKPTPQQAATDTPPAALLTPDEAVAQLHSLQAQLPGIKELTPQERTILRRSIRIPDSAILASLSVIDISSDVAQVVGQPDEVRQQHDDDGRWDTFETELKVLLKRVSDANIIRHQRTRVIAVQAYQIGQQLSRNPGNAGLAEHVDKVKRLRNAGGRKKAAPQTPQTPSPAPAPVPTTTPVVAPSMPSSPAGSSTPLAATPTESQT
jgi:hypothetical protein